MTPFHVGMRVVCVDDETTRFDHPNGCYSGSLHGLKYGCVYTIREVCASTDPYAPSRPSCRLVEIIRPIMNRVETPFALARFRPAHENRMDELRTLLAPVPSKELVQ